MKGNDSPSESVENKNVYDRTNLRTRSVKREKQERSRRGRKPSRPERLSSISNNEAEEKDSKEKLNNSATSDANSSDIMSESMNENTENYTKDSKLGQDNGTEEPLSNASSNSEAKVGSVEASSNPLGHVQASPVLQALGLTRGGNNGVGYTNINLSKALTESNSGILGSNTPNVSQTISTKTVPLLVNMKTAAPSVPSILPANLPPGRYVIISSSTAPSGTTQHALTNTSTTSSLTKTTSSAPTTPVISANNLSTNPVVDLATTFKTTHNIGANHQRVSVLRNTMPVVVSGGGSAGAVASPSTPSPHHVRTPVGKTRGMRKSYTASEKLAMIEAVESGLKKSVVADRFGVAPSTLACIILQKDKIRRDQVIIIIFLITNETINNVVISILI